jgi:hypothetical protein
MAQASKQLWSAVNLESYYYAYTDVYGNHSTDGARTATADQSFSYSELGIPAGSAINWVHFRVGAFNPTPTHGTAERLLEVNGTTVLTAMSAGTEYDITGYCGWSSNAIQIGFTSGKSGTTYPTKSDTGTPNSRKNSGITGFVDVVIIVDYTLPNTAPSAPPWANASPTLVESEQVTISWGASGDAENNITGYRVQYATSTDGMNWSGWSTLGTYAWTSTADTPGVGRGAYEKYQVCAIDAYGAESGYTGTNAIRKNRLSYTPSGLRFGIAATTYFYNSLQCLWSNNGDPDGNFSGVYIRLARYNHDPNYGVVGWAWLDAAWVWIGNVESITYTRADLAAKGAKAGDAFAFGIVSQDALGAQNWDAAGMTASGYVYLAFDPAAPSTFTASPAIQESGVSLAWSGASGGGIAITGYDIEYKVASTAAGADGTEGFATADGSPFATSGTSGSKADPSNITRGYFERWRIRTTTAEGTKSAWKYSNIIQKNRAPVTPSFLFPATGRTTYNTQPYVGLSIGAEPDGQAQTLFYSIDGGAAQNAGAVTAGTKKMRLPTLAVGNHTLRFWLQDSLGAVSGEASVTITVAANTYTRTITGYVSAQQPGTLLWDEVNALRTSSEILELKNRVNQVRAYYGLAAISLPYEATTGTSTIKHFHTWMPNFAAMYQGLADTGAISGASVPARVIKERNGPSAAVVNQIRTMIGSL